MADKPNQHDIDKDKKRFKASFNKVMNSTEISDENKEDFDRYIKKLQYKKEVSYGRLVNVSSYFNKFCTQFFPNKRIKDIDEDDYMDLVSNLREGDFLNKDGNPYSNSTANNYLRFIRAYLTILLGRAKREERLGEITIKEDEIDFDQPVLSYEDIKKILNNIPEKDEIIKFFLAFMFSTGCRSQDIRSLRLKSFSYEKGEDLYVALPKLKTRRRDMEIVVLKPQIEYFINEILKKNKSIGKEDYVLSFKDGSPATLQTLNKKLKRYAKEILGEEFSWVTSHKLRHSSATYFASFSEMSMQQFNYKFGWGENSKVAGRYFLKRTLGKTKIREGMKKDEIQKYEVENDELKGEVKEVKGENQEIKEELGKIRNMLKEQKAINHLEKKHTQHIVLKNSKERSRLTLPSITHSNYQYIKENSLFYKEILEWEDELEEHVTITQTSKSLVFKAGAVIFYKMWNSFSRDVKEELSKANIKTFKDFEHMMLHLIIHGGIINYKVEKEIEEEINFIGQ